MLDKNNSIVIYSNFPFHAEDWSPLSIDQGIGGSEEAVIYLSEEFVKLGYQVTVFNRCGNMEGKYNEVIYKSVDKFNPEDNFNILIVHRSWTDPQLMKVKAKKTALWLHDNPEKFPPMEKSEQLKFLASCDKIFVLSNFHKSALPDWIPENKIFLTANGINLKDFNLTEITRNPKRLISISNYTRGLEHLLTQWPRVLEEVPDVELHIFYGWQVIDAEIISLSKNNIDPKLINKKNDLLHKKQKILQLLNQPNVYEHGRIGHKELVKELLKSGIWVYPCHSTDEIFCISALKAQAAGCVPVATTCGGLEETVKSGIKIQGTAGNEKTNNAFVEAVIYLLKNTDKQEFLRKEVLALKNSFGWDQIAQQWSREFINSN